MSQRTTVVFSRTSSTTLYLPARRLSVSVSLSVYVSLYVCLSLVLEPIQLVSTRYPTTYNGKQSLYDSRKYLSRSRVCMATVVMIGNVVYSHNTVV